MITRQQGAIAMGIRVGALMELRKRGRLLGYTRLKRGGELEPRAESLGRTWWFYRKSDVDNLPADPAYCEGRRRYAKRLRPSELTEEQTMAILDAGAATARENERRRERERELWDLG